MTTQVIPHAAEREGQEPSCDSWWQLPIIACSIGWTAWVLLWARDLWALLREAAPAIDLLADRLGRSKHEIDWYSYDEARDIFCAHGRPEATVIGRHIEASQAYLPVIVVYGMGALTAGAVLWLLTAQTETRLGRMLLWAMPVAVFLAFVPMVWFHDELLILSEVTE